MQPLSHRTATFTDSVIRRMTRVCARYGAVNLSQGFPDFDPPAAVLDRLAEVAHEDYHQYSITWGARDTREALAAKQESFMSWGVAPDAAPAAKAALGLPADAAPTFPIDPETEVVITCGSTEAMMAAMMTVANPGDRVVVFSPFYENYGADAILSGADPVYVPLRPPTYDFDPAELEAALAGRAVLGHPATPDGRPAKALVLCNPSNPCGKVFTRDELRVIADLVEKYDVYVLTDEVYEHIVYAPHRHVYFATLPGMRERTISVSSLSKTYSITGWRLGYTIAPAKITERIKKVHDFLTVGAAAPLQEAVVAGLRMPQAYYDGLLDTYTHKRDLLCAGLDRAGLAHNVPEGAYYVMVDVSAFGYDDDLAFCEDLARKVRVGAVPGSSFFREGPDGSRESRYVRLHFAKRDETLRAALDNLMRVRELMAAR